MPSVEDIVVYLWPFLEPRPTGLGHCRSGIVVFGRGASDEFSEPTADQGAAGAPAEHLALPQRVACAGDGSLFVADYGNGRVCRWKDGHAEVLVGGGRPHQGMAYGVAPGSVSYAVCCDSDGSVFVTTYDAVERLGRHGEDWTKGRPPADGALREATSAAGLLDHCGIAAENNNVVVADHLNHRVLCFSLSTANGEPVFETHILLTRLDSLDFPADVAIVRSGATIEEMELLIADRGSGRILRWANGCLTVLADGLLEPYALALRGDLLYVAEFCADRIVRIDVESGAVVPFADVQKPTGLCIDDEWNLYATERDRARVLCFAPLVA